MLIRQLFQLVFLLVLSLSFRNLPGQDIANITVSGIYKNTPLKIILNDLEKKIAVKFSYLDQFVENERITATLDKKKLPDALKVILAETNLSYKIYSESGIIVLFESKNKKTTAIAKYTLSGYVEDINTGEKLSDANVFDGRLQVGTTTNRYGFFSLTIPVDSISLFISYIGYHAHYKPMFLNRDIQFNIQLIPSPLLGDTLRVIYSDQPVENRVSMGVANVPVTQIKSLPELGGTMDILKTIPSLPGTRFGSQNNSGLYIRGGSPDQNLILIDGAPVYNASHFLGLFPVFNPDAIKNIKITKSGFPARFGGRIIYHTFRPGVFQFDEKTATDLAISDSLYFPDKIYAAEYNVYSEDEIKFSRKLAVNFGFHSSFFSVNDKLYTSLQPRISARYKLGNHLAIKASYATITQYIHLLTNNHIGLPTCGCRSQTVSVLYWLNRQRWVLPERLKINNWSLAWKPISKL